MGVWGSSDFCDQGPTLILAPALAVCLQISAKDSFEVAFNAACGLVETGSLQKAEEQLQLAVRVGEYGRVVCSALRARAECPATPYASAAFPGGS
jgi:hypothetical protein